MHGAVSCCLWAGSVIQHRFLQWECPLRRCFLLYEKAVFCSGTRDACHVPDQLYGLQYKKKICHRSLSDLPCIIHLGIICGQCLQRFQKMALTWSSFLSAVRVCQTCRDSVSGKNGRKTEEKKEQFSEPGVCDCSGTADRGTGRDEQLKYCDHHSRHRSDRSVCIGQKIYAVCVDRGGRSRHDGVVPWDGVLSPGEDRHLEESGGLRKGLSDNPGTLCDRFRRTVRQRIRREHPEARICAGGTE